MTTSLAIALLLVALAGASLGLGLFAARILAQDLRLARRVRALASAAAPVAGAGAAGWVRDPRASGLLAGRNRSAIETFLMRHLDARGRFRSRLAAAGLAMSLSRLLLLCAAAAFAIALGAHALGLGGLPLLILFALALAGLPPFILRVLHQRRRARAEALLPDAIGLMVRGLRAGVPVAETVGEVARETGEPLGGIFRRAHDQARLGQPLEAALREEARALGLPAFDFLLVALSIQRETGGNLVETLDALAGVIRRRHQLRLKVRALSSEARASALIIGALPVLMAVMMAAIAPDYMAPMLETTAGHVLLGLGALSLAVGALVMAALVRIEG